MTVEASASPLPEPLLEKATRVFWEKGYEATSIEDLVARTRMNRAAIYEQYGSKRGLFEALLSRYRVRVSEAMMAPIAGEGASLADVRRFFAQFRNLGDHPMGRLGCMLTIAAAETSPHIPSVARIVGRYLDDLHARLARAIANSQARREISRSVSPAATADYLAGAVLGLMTLARSPAPSSAVRNYVDGVLTFLSGLAARPAARRARTSTSRRSR